MKIHFLLLCSLSLTPMTSCSTTFATNTSGKPGQFSGKSITRIPKALKFRDREEKKIVMEAAGIGGGISLGIGIGTGQNSSNTIGLGSIGGLLGGGIGVKQVSNIRKLKLKAKELNLLIAATNRRTAEVKAYNQALRNYLVLAQVQEIGFAQQVARKKALAKQAEKALQKTQDSIAHIEAAIMKSPEGNASPELRQSHRSLVAERNTLQKQAQLLATN